MDKKISQLTSASTPLAGTETLPIVQGGSTVKTTVQDVLGYVVNDSTNSVLKTVYSGNDVGLKLDFANQVYSIGDKNIVGNGVSLSVENFTEKIYTNYNGVDIGLKLDFANQLFNVGDSVTSFGLNVDITNLKISLKDSTNPLEFYVDGNNALIASNIAGNDVGLKLDFLNSVFSLGDNNILTANAYIELDSNSQIVKITSGNTIKTQYQGNDIGLKLDFVNGVYNLGDFGAAVNGSFFGIDDLNECWVTSNNVTETTAGASANKYILVKIGSTVYKLQLFNYA